MIFPNSRFFNTLCVTVDAHTGLLIDEQGLLCLTKDQLLLMHKLVTNALKVVDHYDLEECNKALRRNARAHIPSQPKGKPNKSGFVYLMLDTTNGFYKIGFSKKPKYREKTLQAEKPTIKLVAKARGTYGDESSLHVRFVDQRIRGEWFDLTPDQVKWVVNSFGNKKGGQ
jgi:hypothetical protein